MGWHHFFFFLLFFSSCFLWRGWVAEGSHVVYPEYMNYEASTESGNAIGPRHRTGYHFQPKEHWINDPNGPMYYNGYYHLFYQYNPKGAVWGNIVWAHSISTDLINWNHLPPAIYPSKPFDLNGCWSGSATILPGKGPAILYTGIDPEQRQVQNIAFPANLSDPYLVEWTKPDYNPVIPPGAGINASAFRDPTTAWRGEDGVWRLLIGTKRKHHHSAELYWGVAALYRSKDFIRWVEAKHPLHASPQTGMWECPDFFPVALEGRRGVDTSVAGEGYKHVLKVSLDLTRFEYYTVGKYDQKTDRYVPDGTSADDRTGLRFDYGNFYASKTFFDPEKKRRILWGWANESDSTMTDIAKGWAGIQTIPRAVWLDKSGRQLVQWPVKELESLRQNEVKVQGVKLSGGSIFQVQGIESSEADVEVSFHVRGLEEAEPWDPTWSTGDPQQLCWVRKAKVRGGVGPFGLLVLASADLSERTAVFFRVFKDLDKYKVLMCHDPTSSTTMEKVYKPTFGGFVDIDIAKHKKISLRSLIDNSVVESFGDGGKTCITSRVYPLVALGSDARIFAFNNGTSDIEIAQLRAWEMGRPQIS